MTRGPRAPALRPPLAPLPVRARPQPKAAVKAGECEDSHEQCSEWAYFGECGKNPKFMDETCKKSCNKCPPKGGAAAGKASPTTPAI